MGYINKVLALVYDQLEKSNDMDLTVCPRSSDPFYIVTYYIKWVTTSLTGARPGTYIRW